MGITKKDLTIWGTVLLVPMLSVIAWMITTTITNADGITEVKARADRFELQINSKVDSVQNMVAILLSRKG